MIKSCLGHRSEREEAFSAIAVDIKAKQTLTEALSMYVDGEVLSGANAYKCTKCSKKVW